MIYYIMLLLSDPAGWHSVDSKGLSTWDGARQRGLSLENANLTKNKQQSEK